MTEQEDKAATLQSLLPQFRQPRQELPENKDKAWKILADYSKIPPEDIESHVRAVRQKAWDIFPYPCIGQWRFLDFYLTTRSEYPSIVQRIQAGEAFLDAGCCFGYILRQLAFDGAPEANLYGTDLRQEFIDLGFDLFRDRETFGGTFVTGNVLDSGDKALESLDGKIDIIHAASFFHLFSWDDQVRVGERLVSFFKPNAEKATLVGRQMGTHTPGPRTGEAGEGSSRYRHNVESFQELWNVIGERTGTKWKVSGEARDERVGPDVERTILQFTVIKAE